MSLNMNSMKKKTLLAGLLLAGTLPLSAQADTIFGVYAGAARWSQEYSGNFASETNGTATSIDVEDDLAIDDSDGNSLWIALEHPVPVLPNIRIERNELKSDGSNVLSRAITYDGDTYNASTTVVTDFDLSHNDYVLYYEVLDNWVNLDLGLDIKQFDGKIRLSGSGQSSEEVLDAPVPMLYVAAKFDLPLTGLSFGGQASGISAAGVTVKDIRFNVAYQFAFGLGIEAGQRNMSIEIDPDEEDVSGDLEFKGNYVAATFHF
ncbi:TIGR04219 family outer membrane beta-barrel protein [Permianibacter sp. IMCC34836]|uniref:TIGR04219 family outer membrane beta-barrel protein n=1 Tax=Permianibacter fluminis TaxID=2738515 RepID=UPI001552F981|nr:TIGR04219 family outer membrane beta-barrel protein [Permianibacter fluminis]NQD38534.1 TIGR04219 family outer membrane beta-barrel protein [Permianibacter fluminis]